MRGGVYKCTDAPGSRLFVDSRFLVRHVFAYLEGEVGFRSKRFLNTDNVRGVFVDEVAQESELAEEALDVPRDQTKGGGCRWVAKVLPPGGSASNSA